MKTLIATTLLVLALPLTGCQPSDPAPSGEQASAASAADENCKRNPPAEPMICTMDWRPVCGCDGVTYPNACGAKAAGIDQYTEGECEGAGVE